MQAKKWDASLMRVFLVPATPPDAKPETRPSERDYDFTKLFAPLHQVKSLTDLR